MKVFIKDIAYCLPEKVVTNVELEKAFPEWSVDKITDKVGIIERRVATSDETATDLAVLAAESLFPKGTVKRADVDLSFSVHKVLTTNCHRRHVSFRISWDWVQIVALSTLTWDARDMSMAWPLQKDWLWEAWRRMCCF